jgi:hypothetical protein
MIYAQLKSIKVLTKTSLISYYKIIYNFQL